MEDQWDPVAKGGEAGVDQTPMELTPLPPPKGVEVGVYYSPGISQL